MHVLVISAKHGVYPDSLAELILTRANGAEKANAYWSTKLLDGWGSLPLSNLFILKGRQEA